MTALSESLQRPSGVVGACRDTALAAIRARIAEIGVPKGELARRLGLHPSEFSTILHGRRSLTPELARDLDVVLQIEARARRAGEVAAQQERERAAVELGFVEGGPGR